MSDLLRWKEPGDGQLMYIHPQGGDIPQGSLLLVDADQVALYRTGGNWYAFGPGKHAAFGDDFTTEELIRAAYEADPGEDLPGRVDTALAFFSTRVCAMETGPAEPEALGGSGLYWQGRLRLRWHICDPLAVISAAGAGQAAEVPRFEETIGETVLPAMRAELARRFPDRFLEGAGTEEVEEILRREFERNGGYGAVVDAANRKLEESGEGVGVIRLEADWHGALLSAKDWDRWKDEHVRCPACGEWIRTPASDVRCARCHARLHLCPAAGKLLHVAGNCCPVCYRTILI